MLSSSSYWDETNEEEVPYFSEDTRHRVAMASLSLSTRFSQMEKAHRRHWNTSKKTKKYRKNAEYDAAVRSWY